MSTAPDVVSGEIVHVPAAMLPMRAEEAGRAMEQYQELTRSQLTADDWQGLPGKPESFVKRQGWQKLATFYNVSTEIRSQEIERDESGLPVRARVIARAVSPNGRYAEGDGACSTGEARFASAKGRGKLEHDLPATATTLAQNRAISNLIGFGAVSAEEVGEEAPTSAPAAALPDWARTTDDDTQLAAAVGSVKQIAGPITVDAENFVIEMGKHFNGVPVACITMLRGLARLFAEARRPPERPEPTPGPASETVYPPAHEHSANRYQGD